MERWLDPRPEFFCPANQQIELDTGSLKGIAGPTLHAITRFAILHGNVFLRDFDSKQAAVPV